MSQSEPQLKLIPSIDETDHQQWSKWLNPSNVFNQFSFLHALEESQCVNTETGWNVQHLQFSQNEETTGFMPLYIKNHSYGEYLFDWEWANGFHRAGLNYYPKAVSSIPFTPVTGPRLIQKTHSATTYKQILSHIDDLNVSNFQSLYVSKQEAEYWQQAGALIRRGHQYSWYNKNYQDFDEFLAQLKSSARKKIKRERRQFQQSKVNFNHYTGQKISQEIWDFFLLCYQRTYLKRSGHEGYLNKHFYDAILEPMRENLLVIVAEYEGQPLAASLCFIAGDTLYGRYWGTIQDIDGLHFEVCYYQGIKFCIENNIKCFQPGTQGDYKRRRGFIPEYTYGAYYFTSDSIRPSIQNYIEQETTQLQSQFESWQNSSPYKQT